MEMPLIIAVIVCFAVCGRLIAGEMNKSRIRSYVSNRGGQVLAIRWSPFGKGWFGEKDACIYEVFYREPDGTEHRATCKTALFSGVYFTEDNILGAPPAGDRVAALEEENRRLREQLRKEM
ncbi:MAG: hypothetical protein QM790_18810 [Nibricoccus sp.]